MSKTIDSIDIEITDQDDKEIDFANREWTITLNLELHRKRNIQSPETLLLANIKELISSFIPPVQQVEDGDVQQVEEPVQGNEVTEEPVQTLGNDELNDDADTFADSNLQQYLYLKGIEG